ncbi:MAG: ABC transporter permease [Sporichthyaceae bacterium]
MSTATAPAAPAAVPPRRRSTLLIDSWIIAKRNLIHVRRAPEALSDATIQPIMFVLLFAYVFGGAIAVPGGGDYKEFLMGGIYAQTIVFGCFGVAMALANDRNNGAIDRFHSMPINPAAVLAGHSIANLFRSLLPIVLMSLTGAVVGWRIRGGAWDTIMAYGLMVGFSFAMIWVGVVLGTVCKTAEAVQGISFVVIFPITFISSAFVPSDSLPNGLRQFAQWNPTTTLADALRTQFYNPGGANDPAVDLANAPWSIQHSTTYTWLWIVGIVVVCVPLSARLYRRAFRG